MSVLIQKGTPLCPKDSCTPGPRDALDAGEVTAPRLEKFVCRGPARFRQ